MSWAGSNKGYSRQTFASILFPTAYADNVETVRRFRFLRIAYLATRAATLSHTRAHSFGWKVNLKLTRPLRKLNLRLGLIPLSPFVFAHLEIGTPLALWWELDGHTMRRPNTHSSEAVEHLGCTDTQTTLEEAR